MRTIAAWPAGAACLACLLTGAARGDFVAYNFFGADIAGNSRPEAGFVKKITEMLSIDRRLDHRPSELSGGEQQRVALARALINRPAIVLADEPTGNLDSKNSAIVLNMLRQSNKELGQTVLMITHNPEAADYGDRIIHMRDGQIVAAEEDPQWSPHHPPVERASS